MIQVIYNDMLQEPVSAIVNSANQKIDMTGGLSGAIGRKAGESIIKAVRDHVKTNGSLAYGEVFVTEGGKLPSKYIIHCAGPNYPSSGKTKAYAEM